MQIKKYKKKFSIAVDGQSATGKSTGSKFISKYFDFDYLSSGKLYRYCAYILLKKKGKTSLQIQVFITHHFYQKNIIMLNLYLTNWDLFIMIQEDLDISKF